MVILLGSLRRPRPEKCKFYEIFEFVSLYKNVVRTNTSLPVSNSINVTIWFSINKVKLCRA